MKILRKLFGKKEQKLSKCCKAPLRYVKFDYKRCTKCGRFAKEL